MGWRSGVMILTSQNRGSRR